MEITDDKAGQAPAAESLEATEPITFDAEYVKGLRAEAAASRVRANELETSLAALKPEAEAAATLREQLAVAEAKAKSLELGAIRSKAASVHNVPADLHEFITAEDEPGALAQAAKLAAGLKPASGLPAAGKRNPAAPNSAAVKLDEFTRLEKMAQRVPGMSTRVLKG